MTRSQWFEVGSNVFEILHEDDYRRSSGDDWVIMTNPYSAHDIFLGANKRISPYTAVNCLKENSLKYEDCPSYLQPYWDPKHRT